jgi:integrase
LRAAIAKIGCSSFMRMRRFAMLRVLQKTGARRIEVVQLTVASVKQAMAMAKPRLLVNTAKGKDGEVRQRLVPIDKQDLVLLDDYIETSRAVVIANTIGSERDHGLLFINSRTGQPLVPNTVTLELHLLAKAAGLNGNAHPHLFRHRFVMVRIQILKDELQIGDKASFEQMYVTNMYIAGRLTQETGHASLTSLLPYINNTYPETPQAQIIAERIEADGFAASFKAGVEELAVLKESMPPEEFAARAMRFMGQAVGQIAPNK